MHQVWVWVASVAPVGAFLAGSPSVFANPRRWAVPLDATHGGVRDAIAQRRCPLRTSSRRTCMFDAGSLYELQNWAGNVATNELTHVSPLSLGVLYATGLLMAFSPCALSLLPLTVGYIAGTVEVEGHEEEQQGGGGGGAREASSSSVSEYDEAHGENSSSSSMLLFDDDGNMLPPSLQTTEQLAQIDLINSEETKLRKPPIKGGKNGAFLPSLAFAGGLATVLAALGLFATFAGKLFGSAVLFGGENAVILPLASSALATAMGLSLLGLLDVNLPSFEAGVGGFKGLPRAARAFVLGASSALVASPCCTPVLASILGFVAASRDPFWGLALLLAYSMGYTTPLVVAGTASGALSRVMRAEGLTWVTPASGAALICYGTYTGLSAVFGA